MIRSQASATEQHAFLHVRFHPFQISRQDIQDDSKSTCAATLLSLGQYWHKAFK